MVYVFVDISIKNLILLCQYLPTPLCDVHVLCYICQAYKVYINLALLNRVSSPSRESMCLSEHSPDKNHHSSERDHHSSERDHHSSE